jgi:hypothetical protein
MSGSVGGGGIGGGGGGGGVVEAIGAGGAAGAGGTIGGTGGISLENEIQSLSPTEAELLAEYSRLLENFNKVRPFSSSHFLCLSILTSSTH